MNEDRVKLMTKLAIFKQKNEDKIKMNNFYRHDYIGLKFIGNVFWFTIAYVLIIGIIMLIRMDTIISNMTLDWVKQNGIKILIIYLIRVFICGIIGHFAYRRQHKKAREQVRRYYGGLKRLEKMYREEDR